MMGSRPFARRGNSVEANALPGPYTVPRCSDAKKTPAATNSRRTRAPMSAKKKPRPPTTARPTGEPMSAKPEGRVVNREPWLTVPPSKSSVPLTEKSKASRGSAGSTERVTSTRYRAAWASAASLNRAGSFGWIRSMTTFVGGICGGAATCTPRRRRDSACASVRAHAPTARPACNAASTVAPPTKPDAPKTNRSVSICSLTKAKNVSRLEHPENEGFELWSGVHGQAFPLPERVHARELPEETPEGRDQQLLVDPLRHAAFVEELQGDADERVASCRRRDPRPEPSKLLVHEEHGIGRLVDERQDAGDEPRQPIAKRTLAGGRGQRLARQAQVAALEQVQRQRVLALEVLEEDRVGEPGLLRDGADARLADPVAREELQGRLEQLLFRGRIGQLDVEGQGAHERCG